MGSASLRGMCSREPAWNFQNPLVALQSEWKKRNLFSPYLGAEQICYIDVWISMETVLILALPHLMPTWRVQCWVRAQGLGKVSWP